MHARVFLICISELKSVFQCDDFLVYSAKDLKMRIYYSLE